MSPIELFLTFVDQVVALVRERGNDKAKLFNDVVDPLFSKLEPVAADYAAIFRLAHRDLENAQLSAREISNRVSAGREVMLQGRVRVTAMANALRARAADDKLAEFADEIVSYFTDGVDTSMMGATPSYYLADLLAKGEVREASAFVDRMLKGQGDSWRTIVKKHSNLRLDCLGPSGYIKKA